MPVDRIPRADSYASTHLIYMIQLPSSIFRPFGEDLMDLPHQDSASQFVSILSSNHDDVCNGYLSWSQRCLRQASTTKTPVDSIPSFWLVPAAPSLRTYAELTMDADGQIENGHADGVRSASSNATAWSGPEPASFDFRPDEHQTNGDGNVDTANGHTNGISNNNAWSAQRSEQFDFRSRFPILFPSPCGSISFLRLSLGPRIADMY